MKLYTGIIRSLTLKYFLKELKESLEEKKTCEYKVFEEIFLNLLFLHAPTKKKVIRANNMLYMRL